MRFDTNMHNAMKSLVRLWIYDRADKTRLARLSHDANGNDFVFESEPVICEEGGRRCVGILRQIRAFDSGTCDARLLTQRAAQAALPWRRQPRCSRSPEVIRWTFRVCSRKIRANGNRCLGKTCEFVFVMSSRCGVFIPRELTLPIPRDFKFIAAEL